MRTTYFYPLLIFLLIITAGQLTAQDITGGTVKYQQITKYNFKTIFGDFKDPRAKEWVASLPTESEGLVTLAFSEKTALYDKNLENQILPDGVKDAQLKVAFTRAPKPELKKVFYDFENKEVIRQVEFMTRIFRVSEAIQSKAWKLTNKMTKILDYTCLGAELKNEDRTILAYFTSELPFSIGPDEFFGLPGVVLAVEINGETAYLAKSIDLTTPGKALLAKPEKGKKVTREEFDKIIAEKTKEFNETRKSKWNRKK